MVGSVGNESTNI